MMTDKQPHQPFALDPNFFSVAENYLRLLDRRHRGGSQDFCASCFSSLDKAFPGWLHDGHLIIVAGRPGSGKSVFCQQVAEVVATNKTVLFVSYEMSRLEVAERSIARRSGVSLSRLRVASDLNPGDFGLISSAIIDCSVLSLRISDDCWSIGDLSERVARYPEELAAMDLPPLGLLVVDYLQLVPSGDRRGTANRAQVVGEVSRSLKRLAQSCQIPVLAAAQINRETEGRPDKRPNLGDLRESGSIEQDADFVAFLYRDELYNGPDKGVAEVLVKKNRHGATGVTKLRFDGGRVAFSDIPVSSPSSPFQIANKTVAPVAQVTTTKEADHEKWY